VPGVAKTLTATTLAQAISAKFQRIQLTPDLLPADILGTRIYDANSATFRIEKGPIFTNILLADEINRATPKTQSALLEAMQERQVTLADTTFPLEDPFWVLATQNPVEQEGVYTLPEAQLDRFSMMLRVGYPSHDEEVGMLQVRLAETVVEHRVSPDDVNALREFIRATISTTRFSITSWSGRATRWPDEVGRADLKELLQLGTSPGSFQHVLALARHRSSTAARGSCRRT
jgi:MoxR-like ATPase